MRWFGREESSHVEDRRGMGSKGWVVGGGGGLVLVLLAWFLGINPDQLPLPQVDEDQASEAHRPSNPKEERLASFTKVIFRDTEIVWEKQFQSLSRRYTPPTLVLYSSVVESACGFAQAAVGPFYCPSDAKVYIDLSFYEDLERKLQSPGDFAKAYVIAHEVGRHVQRLLGFVRSFDNFEGDRHSHGSVQRELQADFLAGVWANHAEEDFQYLEEGDLQTALNAAFQIGDDRLQLRAKGYVVPDSFTHGSSRERVAAFKTGFESGNVRLADRFSEIPAASE
jgi:uncharacterized protein